MAQSQLVIKENLTKAIRREFKKAVKESEYLSPIEIHNIYAKHLQKLLEVMEGNHYNETFLMQTLLTY